MLILTLDLLLIYKGNDFKFIKNGRGDLSKSPSFIGYS